MVYTIRVLYFSMAPLCYAKISYDIRSRIKSQQHTTLEKESKMSFIYVFQNISHLLINKLNRKLAIVPSAKYIAKKCRIIKVVPLYCLCSVSIVWVPWYDPGSIQPITFKRAEIKILAKIIPSPKDHIQNWIYLSSVTRFGNILWIFVKWLRVCSVFGNFFNLLWQNCNVFGLHFNVVFGQMLKII